MRLPVPNVSNMFFFTENPNCPIARAEKPLNEWVLYKIPHENVSSYGGATTSIYSYICIN